MNHAKKLQLLAVLGVLTISSASLVQAADIPVVSSGGATYNIGLQGWSMWRGGIFIDLSAVPILLSGSRLRCGIFLHQILITARPL